MERSNFPSERAPSIAAEHEIPKAPPPESPVAPDRLEESDADLYAGLAAGIHHTSPSGPTALTDATMAGFNPTSLLALRAKVAQSIVRGESQEFTLPNGGKYVISRPEQGGLKIESQTDSTGSGGGLTMHIDPSKRIIPKDPSEVRALTAAIDAYIAGPDDQTAQQTSSKAANEIQNSTKGTADTTGVDKTVSSSRESRLQNLESDLNDLISKTKQNGNFKNEIDDYRFLFTNERELKDIDTKSTSNAPDDDGNALKASFVIGQSDFPFMLNRLNNPDAVVIADYNTKALDFFKRVNDLFSSSQTYAEFEGNLRKDFDEYLNSSLSPEEKASPFFFNPMTDAKKNLEAYLNLNSVVAQHASPEEKEQAFQEAKKQMANKKVFYLPLDIKDQTQLKSLGDTLKKNNVQIDFANLNNVIPYVAPSRTESAGLAKAIRENLPMTDQTLVYSRKRVDPPRWGSSEPWTTGAQAFLDKFSNP